MGDIIRFICIVVLYHILWGETNLATSKTRQRNNTTTQQQNNIKTTTVESKSKNNGYSVVNSVICVVRRCNKKSKKSKKRHVILGFEPGTFGFIKQTHTHYAIHPSNQWTLSTNCMVISLKKW